MERRAGRINKPLSGKVALVTGASSGVGKSIALALAEQGADLALLGRRLGRLNAIAKDCERSGATVACFAFDLENEQPNGLVKEVAKKVGNIDILVHSAGEIQRANVTDASVSEFDRQYRINVRAPFDLTRVFLPRLIKRKGHVVFINSTIGLVGSAGVSQYAATKHALKGFADSLREEVSAHGVRVLSVYLGRTATPMQKKVHQWEKKKYVPERLIQPRQVASIVISALSLGSEAEVTDIRIRPTIKPA